MEVKYKVMLLFVLVLALAVGLRALFLIRGQFIDPVTMAAVLTMKQAIANGFVIHNDTLAGFPAHKYVFPEEGIVYLAIVPYRILGFMGLFGVMYLLKVIFTVCAATAIYLFARRMTGSQKAGLLGMLLYAISQVGAYTEAFNRWMGDSFVPTLIIVAVLALLYLVEMPRDKKIRTVAAGGLVAGCLVLSVLVWNGGAYAVAVFAFTCIAIVIGDRLRRKTRLFIALGIITLVGWVVLLASPLQGAIGLGSISMPASLFGNDVVQFIGQFEPLAYQPALLYNSMPLYLVWIAAGFLSSVWLAFITIVKFPIEVSQVGRRAYVASAALLVFGIPFAFISPRFNSLVFMPIAILGGCMISVLDGRYRRWLFGMLAVAVALTLLFEAYQIIYTPQYAGMSPLFHRDLEIVAMYTPQNATFMNFDGDGTAIQYWAGRNTYTDTNIADNQSDVLAYYKFIYARAGNFTYLNEIKPDYLLIHQIPSNNTEFNTSFYGSNIQYFIEWAYNSKPRFSYDGVNFTLIYANFSIVHLNRDILLYKLSYANATTQ